MDQQNLNLIKEEFDQNRKQWTNITLQRIFSYEDLKIRLAEREFQFTLFLTTIAIAFLSIILPLLLDSEYKISKITIIAFLCSSLFGFIRVFLSIIIDEKEIPKDEKSEIDYFTKCQKLAVKIYNEALMENIPKQERNILILGKVTTMYLLKEKKKKIIGSRKFYQESIVFF